MGGFYLGSYIHYRRADQNRDAVQHRRGIPTVAMLVRYTNLRLRSRSFVFEER